MEQKLNSNSSAGAAADSDIQPIIITSAGIAVSPMLVAAFPGTGKSYYVNYGEGSGYMPQGFATDSDSSKFDKANFPANYIEHIKQCIKDGYARIFISTHKEVMVALVANDLKFTLVYPKENLKEEYLQRYKERGSSQAFIDLIDKNWSNWLFELHRQTGCTRIELESGQFISNVM
jgi:hypothetical protein